MNTRKKSFPFFQEMLFIEDFVVPRKGTGNIPEEGTEGGDEEISEVDLNEGKV